jgi:hypothetical protein
LFRTAEPHPLDSDWRFSQATIQRLLTIIPKSDPLLLIGTPSLARALEGSHRKVLLVDRQPVQGVSNHLAVEAGTVVLPRLEFSGAVIDPPWYPAAWRKWTAWAASAVGAGCEVTVSIWPEDTRPSAAIELSLLRDWLSQWADFEKLDFESRYDTPQFERIAHSVETPQSMGFSPRHGSLFRFRKRKEAPQEFFPLEKHRWLRFLLNDYQLALRLGDSTDPGPGLHQVEGSNGWIWPFVSNRAPGRSSIDLWSSRNEVAKVHDPIMLAQVIKAALKSETKQRFDNALIHFPELLEWQIPRPPYERVAQWEHRQ